MGKKDDLYIAVLKHARDRLEKGMSPNDLRECFGEEKHTFDDHELFYSQIYRDVFAGLNELTFKGNQNKVCWMKMEAYFLLLEYHHMIFLWFLMQML